MPLNTIMNNSSDPRIQHHFAGGVYAKEITLDSTAAGMNQHEHTFDHLSILTQGQVIIDIDGLQTTLTAPAVLTVKAGQRHKIIPTQVPVTWFCIHATTVVDADLVDDSLILKREYYAV
jgi:mannose-6-phosphate isomerase-like protein (cupin superfamily)